MESNQLKEKINWIQVFILALVLPVLIELAFRFLQIKDKFVVIEFIYIILILPVYLVQVHKYFDKKITIENFNRIFALLILSCFLVCSLISYLNWSNTTKKNLDAESRDVAELEFIFQFIIGLFFTIAASLIVCYKKRTSTNV